MDTCMLVAITFVYLCIVVFYCSSCPSGVADSNTVPHVSPPPPSVPPPLPSTTSCSSRPSRRKMACKRGSGFLLQDIFPLPKKFRSDYSSDTDKNTTNDVHPALKKSDNCNKELVIVNGANVAEITKSLPPLQSHRKRGRPRKTPNVSQVVKKPHKPHLPKNCLKADKSVSEVANSFLVRISLKSLTQVHEKLSHRLQQILKPKRRSHRKNQSIDNDKGSVLPHNLKQISKSKKCSQSMKQSIVNDNDKINNFQSKLSKVNIKQSIVQEAKQRPHPCSQTISKTPKARSVKCLTTPQPHLAIETTVRKANQKLGRHKRKSHIIYSSNDSLESEDGNDHLMHESIRLLLGSSNEDDEQLVRNHSCLYVHVF